MIAFQRLLFWCSALARLDPQLQGFIAAEGGLSIKALRIFKPVSSFSPDADIGALRLMRMACGAGERPVATWSAAARLHGGLRQGDTLSRQYPCWSQFSANQVRPWARKNAPIRLTLSAA